MQNKIQYKNPDCSGNNKDTNAETRKKQLAKALEDNIALFRGIFSKDGTLIVREFQNKSLKEAKCCIIYLDGMVNTEIVNENIIQPILRSDLSRDIDSNDLLEELRKKVIVSNSVTPETDVNKIVGSVIYGDTLFLLEGYEKALVISTKGWQSRSITEPESTRVVRGPREGFTKSIIVNLSMVCRRINSPDLKFKFREIGARTHTKTCICYIEGLASEDVLKELERRLDKINIDGIIDSGYIQELIKDAPYSPFETVGHSERPDVIAAKLLEARIALFVDGSPFVLTVPYLVGENFQANEDYYNSFPFAETVVFIGVFSSLKTKKSNTKVYLIGALISGVIIIITTARNILILGNMLGDFYFPSYEAVSRINIGDFIQRIEVTVALIFVYGVFIKSAICLLVACKGIGRMFNLRDYRSIVIQMGLLMIYFSYIVYDNIMDMKYWAFEVYSYYAFPMQVMLPVIIWIIAEIKARRKKCGKNT